MLSLKLYETHKIGVQSVFKDVHFIISSYLADGQTNTIGSNAIKINYRKSNVTNLPSIMQLTEGSINPSSSFCSMYADSTGFSSCTSKTIVTAVVSYDYTLIVK